MLSFIFKPLKWGWRLKDEMTTTWPHTYYAAMPISIWILHSKCHFMTVLNISIMIFDYSICGGMVYYLEYIVTRGIYFFRTTQVTMQAQPLFKAIQIYFRRGPLGVFLKFLETSHISPRYSNRAVSHSNIVVTVFRAV